MERVSRLVVLLVTLTACGTGAPGATSGPGSRWVFAGTDDVSRFQLEETPTSTMVVMPAPLDTVLKGVLAAYEELEIPVTRFDRAGGVVANPAFRVSRTLAGRRLSTMLNCGRTAEGGSAADQYRLVLDIASSLESLGADTTRVSTTLSARARSPSGSRSGDIACESRGALEESLLKRTYLHVFGQEGAASGS
ncbi:MAG: hypothetical protein ACOC5I_00235 [Gemmatimonadota bacterium]